MNLQSSVPAFPVLLPLAVLLVIIGLELLRRTGQMTAARVLTVLAAVVYLVAALRLTTLPLQIAIGSFANQTPWYEKFTWIPLLTIDLQTFALNIIMTIPLGVLLPLLAHIDTMRRAALAGLLFSAAIETLQLLTNLLLSSGDMADINDLLANTTGAIIGFALLTKFELTRRLADPFRIHARRPGRI